MRVFGVSLLLLLLSLAGAQGPEDWSTEELLRSGETLYARGNCIASLVLFNQVLEREPENADATLGKGRSLVCEGSFAEGIDAFKRVLQTHSERPEAYLLLANAYLAQYGSDEGRYGDRLGEALGVLEQAEAAGASEAELYNLRGVIYYRQGNYGRAREALERAISLGAGVPDYHENLGLTYLQLGELEQAVAAFKRAVTLNPDSVLARNQLGASYLLLDRCNDAIAELKRAVSLAPEQLEANLNLGRALFDCGEVGASRPYFEKVVELDIAAYPVAHTYLARIYLAEGNYSEAVTAATKGALLQPNAEAYYWLGQAYEARNDASDDTPDTQKAREAYERALQIDSSFTPAREALAQP